MRKSDISKAEETSAEPMVCSKKKCGGMKGKFMTLVVVIVLVVVGYYGWQYAKNSGLSLPGGVAGDKNLTAEQKQAQQEILAVVAKVKRLMVVPENELPQMAEIKDAALAAKDQPFYAGSQNGDKVLVYVAARKAIIYSPSRNIIVNVGPVYMDEAKSTAPTQATPSATTSTPTPTPAKKK